MSNGVYDVLAGMAKIKETELEQQKTQAELELIGSKTKSSRISDKMDALKSITSTIKSIREALVEVDSLLITEDEKTAMKSVFMETLRNCTEQLGAE